jgi:hypothetical protein
LPRTRAISCGQSRSQAAGIDHLQNGRIAKIKGGVKICGVGGGFHFLGGSGGERRKLFDCQKDGIAFFQFGQGKILDGRGADHAFLNEILVKRAQRGKSKLNGRAAQLAPAQEAQKVAEIIAAQRRPIGRPAPLLPGPSGELD